MVKKIGDKPELLTKEEMDKLLLTVSDNLYFNTLYNVLKHTGRRIGEIYGTNRDKKLTGGIKVKDIDFENRTMTTSILKTKKRKLEVTCICKQTNSYKNKFCKECGSRLPDIDKSKLYYDSTETKQIQLKANLIFLLQKYIKTNKLGKERYLFREWSLIFLKKQIHKHCELAGIKKKFSLHGFRHYFITNCKRSGLTNDQIALWTGHKNIDTLNIYTHLVPKDVEDKILAVEL